MNVTVYLGSTFGNDDKYAQKTYELGALIAKKGHSLVYGGSKEGLMGILADAALENGAEVTGVEPEFFIEQAVQHEGITELIVVETMAERKSIMMNMGDVFIAFPGGVGTLEEIAEILSMMKLDKVEGSAVFYNLDGFYEPMRMMLEKMVSEGFLSENELGKVMFFDTIDEIAEIL